MLLRSNFSSFPHYFIYIFLTSGVKLHIHLLNVVVQFIVFLTLSTLICRSTDIWKCFSESLGIRDNGSRLYFDKFISVFFPRVAGFLLKYFGWSAFYPMDSLTFFTEVLKELIDDRKKSKDVSTCTKNTPKQTAVYCFSQMKINSVQEASAKW